MITIEHIRNCFTPSGSSNRTILTIDGYARAGVLVPLVLTPNGVELLLTQRTETVETHKGQIAFPGGMVDASDRDIVRTALRETCEEIGLPAASIEIIGQLDDMATPTGFVITPVVGAIAHLPPLMPNSNEVAEIFAVPLDFFADPANGRREMREFNGRSHEVWFYPWQGKTIWGATAMMVRSLLKKIAAR